MCNQTKHTSLQKAKQTVFHPELIGLALYFVLSTYTVCYSVASDYDRVFALGCASKVTDSAAAVENKHRLLSTMY